MRSECIACHSEQVAAIHAYKNVWVACGVCSAISREPRRSYLASRVPGLESLVRGEGARGILFGDRSVHERESAAYDYYRDLCARGAIGSRWEHEVDVLEAELAPRGFTLDVPRLLDVSGGPGFLAQKLQQKGAYAVVTEFSPQAVSAMHDRLGVVASVFDYNRHDLPDVLPPVPRGGTAFEAILARYSLNFCLDLPRFARGAHAVAAKDALLYLSYARPTVGCVVHWDHVEYTYNVLYPSNYVRSVFEHAGFQFVGEIPSEHKGYDWTRGLDWRLRSFIFPQLALALANVNLRRPAYRAFAALASSRTVTCEEVYRRR